MNITYDGNLLDDLSKVRFHLHDTQHLKGPRPGDENFSDEELQGLITLEGSWQGAVAAAFEALESEWSTSVSFKAGQQSSDLSDISKKYGELATKWRAKVGGSTASGTSAVTRVDGYSSDVDGWE